MDVFKVYEGLSKGLRYPGIFRVNMVIAGQVLAFTSVDQAVF